MGIDLIKLRKVSHDPEADYYHEGQDKDLTWSEDE